MLAKRFLLINLILGLTGAGWSQEPEPEPEDLPRIPPKSAVEEEATFALRPGLRIELVASEPQIEDPIAISFSPDGALFVCEMRGYSERREEALGRISRLMDADGDGFYEQSTPYVEGLKWPTGVIAWDGGVFVLATPELLYCKDEDGDGKAEVREVIFTGFAEGAKRLNVQALANSLTWGPDRRIYGATAGNGGLVRRAGDTSEPQNLRGSDFSFDPLKWDLRRESGTAQYGLCFDDFGQRYVCSNSRHALAVFYSWPWNERANLPSPLVSIPDDGGAAEVYRTSAVEPWRRVRTRWRVQGLVRGPIEGGGRAAGYITSASGLCIYRGDALPGEFRGNLFVGDVGGNLVHRKRVLRSEEKVALTATRPADEQSIEFLTSTDNWFRPVQCANGPDGALYIVDMYREVIEHPWSLPESIKQHLDLNSGNQLGRIWRVVPETWDRPEPVLPAQVTPPNLPGLLKHPNGWTREAAQQEMHLRQEPETVARLQELAISAPQPETRFAALSSLHALYPGRELPEETPRDESTRVRALATRLASHPDLEAAAQDPSAWVRFEATLRLLDPGQGTSLELLGELAREGGWLTSVAAEAAMQRGVLAEVLVQEPNLDIVAEILEAARYRPQPEDLATLQPLFVRARDQKDSTAALQISALDPESPEALWWDVLDGGDPERSAIALSALQSRGASWESRVLERWSSLPASLHNQLILQLSDPELLQALEAETLVPAEIPLSRQEALRNHKTPEIREHARALLAEVIPQSREEATQKYRHALDLTGNAERGKLHYQQRCAVCHDALGAAPALGPERDSFRAQGKPMLLENILDPNREVAPQYLAWKVELMDGSQLNGRLLRETADQITMGVQAVGERVIPREEVRRLTNLNQSLMPPGLESGMTLQDMADLLSFLKGE